MQDVISISESSQIAWIPKSLIEAGFKGKVPVIKDALTIVLLHPNASLDDVEKSLKLIIQNIQLRKKLTRSSRLRERSKDE